MMLDNPSGGIEIPPRELPEAFRIQPFPSAVDPVTS